MFHSHPVMGVAFTLCRASKLRIKQETGKHPYPLSLGKQTLVHVQTSRENTACGAGSAFFTDHGMCLERGVELLDTAVVSIGSTKRVNLPLIHVDSPNLVDSNTACTQVVQMDTATEDGVPLFKVVVQGKVETRPATLNDPHSPLHRLTGTH